MTKHYSNRKLSGLLSIILGPIFILSIALATANLFSTYKTLHYQKQESIWSIVQLDKEMGNALFETQRYINSGLNEKPLKTSYEILWSRFPVAISSLKRDDIFSQISGLTDLIHIAFDHIKSAELMILGPGVINKTKLKPWVRELNGMANEINQQLLQNIAASNSEYSTKTFNKILTSALVPVVLIATFILYLGYLLITLRKEQRLNLHMLAHDTLTELYSRDMIMRTINSFCENKTPFGLLSFDLNKFKSVNDTFGHHAGDQLLIHLAEKFKKTLSKFGMVGRIGGDEFLWITDSNDPQIIRQQYSLFLRALKDPCVINDKKIYLHISAGGGIAADCDFHETCLLENVDQAMYQAKSQQLKEIFWDNSTINQPKNKAAII